MNIKGNFRSKGNEVEFNLPIIQFKEDTVYFFYTPALDLTGYGNSEEEAKASFEETLTQFLAYTTNKKTLSSELRKLGWKVSKHKVASPSLTQMLRDNQYLVEIFEEKAYTKFDQTYSIPAFA